MNRRERALRQRGVAGNRAGRRSNWQANIGKEPKPRFREGDQAGEFTIASYLGWHKTHPKSGKVLHSEHHWYMCTCSCGTKEVHTQQQLIDTRRNRACVNCVGDIKQHNHKLKTGGFGFNNLFGPKKDADTN